MKRLLFVLLLFIYTALSFAQPAPCEDPAAMTSSCAEACVICDIDGFSGTNNLTIQGQTFNGFCTTMFHNMSYIAFIAGTEDLVIEVSVTNCQINWGVEIGFFESVDCQTFIPVTDCNTDVSPNTTVTFSNDVPLTVGGHYFLIMDGSNSDICDWEFNVVQGSTEVPPIPFTGDITVATPTTCPDLPATFTVADTPGAAIFYWTVNGAAHNSISQTTDITFPGDGTYEICVAAANACDEAAPSCFTYQVITPGTLTLDEVLCDNDCLEVAGETLCDPGDYEFHITLPNGCDSAIFVTLEILPQAQSFVDINLCSTDTFFIGMNPYNTTGFFQDTVQTSMDCDSIVMLDLFIVECNIEANTDFIQPVCTGEENGFLIFSVENGTPPFTYLWEHLTIPGIGGSGNTLLFDNNQISDVPAGIYEINISDNFGNLAVVFQEVTDPPILNIAASALDIDDFNVSCNGGSDGVIRAFPSGGVPPYSYLWSTGGTLDSVEQVSAGTYTLSLTDANGCVVTTDIELTEPTPIEVFANFIDPNCDGYDTGIITRDSTQGGTPSYRYSLDPDTFKLVPYFDSLLPGPYTLYVIDDNDCIVDTTATLGTPDIPEIFFLDGMEVDLGCDIKIPTLTNNTTITDIIWTPNRAIDCDTCLRPVVAPVDRTTYALTLTSIDDCTDTDSVTVHVNKIRDVYFPNAFSPNGDGINDLFFIGTGKSVAQIDYLKIFDRWGEQVYEGLDLPPGDERQGWDGLFNGKRMGNGVYIWIAEITFVDGFVLQYSGDISVMK